MRDIEFLRDRMNMPVTYDKVKRGYVVNRPDAFDATAIPFPGMWLTTDEAYALLTLFNITRRIDPGVFYHFMDPLTRPLKRVLGQAGYPMMGFDRKVKIELPFAPLPFLNRRVFAVVVQALLFDKTMSISVQDRGGRTGECTVRPVALVLTLEGWSLEVVAAESQDQTPTRYALSAIIAASTEKDPKEASRRMPRKAAAST